MQAVTNKLLSWYRKNRILYPWRRTKDPYRIWLSEILLQQTRIPVVLRYYRKIVRLFPTLKDLAAANDASFLAAWSGIGYYSRAHNMLRCAREVGSRYAGRFPESREALMKLPGIGAYTAGAIRNVCFHQLTPSIDGNIRRVLARVSGTDLPPTRKFQAQIEKSFMLYGEGASPAEYFQALMEIGEQICLPVPKCPQCPIRNLCKAYLSGTEQRIPRKRSIKKAVPYHWYFVLLRRGDSAYYVQNKARQFLKNAWIFPDLLSSTPLRKQQLKSRLEQRWKFRLQDLSAAASLRHAVTFRKISVHVLESKNWKLRNGSGKWLTQDKLRLHPTSSITDKVFQKMGSERPTSNRGLSNHGAAKHVESNRSGTRRH